MTKWHCILLRARVAAIGAAPTQSQTVPPALISPVVHRRRRRAHRRGGPRLLQKLNRNAVGPAGHLSRTRVARARDRRHLGRATGLTVHISAGAEAAFVHHRDPSQWAIETYTKSTDFIPITSGPHQPSLLLASKSSHFERKELDRARRAKPVLTCRRPAASASAAHEQRALENMSASSSVPMVHIAGRPALARLGAGAHQPDVGERQPALRRPVGPYAKSWASAAISAERDTGPRDPNRRTRPAAGLRRRPWSSVRPHRTPRRRVMKHSNAEVEEEFFRPAVRGNSWAPQFPVAVDVRGREFDSPHQTRIADVSKGTRPPKSRSKIRLEPRGGGHPYSTISRPSKRPATAADPASGADGTTRGCPVNRQALNPTTPTGALAITPPRRPAYARWTSHHARHPRADRPAAILSIAPDMSAHPPRGRRR